MSKSWILVALCSMALGVHAARLGIRPIQAGEAPPAPAPVSLPAWRSSCGLKAPFRLTLRATMTPVVDQEVTLVVTCVNGYKDGPIRTWLTFPPGSVQTSSAVEWVDDIAKGAMATHQVSVKVTSQRPFGVTAKAAPLDPDYGHRKAGEAHLQLFPFVVGASGVSTHWTISRAPEISLRNGKKGAVMWTYAAKGRLTRRP